MHSKAQEERLEKLMMNTGMLTKDSWHDSCRRGGGEGGLDRRGRRINQAFLKLHSLIDARKSKKN